MALAFSAFLRGSTTAGQAVQLVVSGLEAQVPPVPNAVISCLVIHVYEVFFMLLFSDIFLTFLCIMSTFSETYFSKNLLSVSC